MSEVTPVKKICVFGLDDHGIKCTKVCKEITGVEPLYLSLMDGWEQLLDYDYDILSISRAYNTMSDYKIDILRKVHEKGVTILASAGNDGKDESIGYPAKLEFVVCVGAYDPIYEKVTSYTQTGESLDIVAPTNFWIPGSNNYYMFTHTSCACPVMASFLSTFEFGDVWDFLEWNSKDLGEEGKDIDSGYGLFYNRGEEMNNPNKIIIHHSATDGGTFESIRKYHMDKGFVGIAYNYLIETDCSVHIGRAETATGAHTLGQNEQSIGICLVGNFDEYEPTVEQYATLKLLIAEIRLRWGDLPLFRHSDFANKTCPGRRFDLAMVDYPKDLSEWAKEAYDYEVANGLTDGTRPKDPVTREENWVTDYRFHKLEEKMENLLATTGERK